MKRKMFKILKIGFISLVSFYILFFILAKLGWFSLGMNKKEPVEIPPSLSLKIEKLNESFNDKVKNTTIIDYPNIDEVALFEKDNNFNNFSNTFSIDVKIIDTVFYKKDSVSFKNNVYNYIKLVKEELPIKNKYDSIKVNCFFYNSSSYSSDIIDFSKSFALPGK